MEISSADESDGQSALRAVQDQEKRKAARPGPQNESMKHFNAPTASFINKGKGKEKRWQFRCKYCPSAQSVIRTVPDDASFNDEPKLPKLNNLSGHISTCKGAPKVEASEEAKTGTKGLDQMNLKRSIEFMEAYLKDSELNLQVVRTYRGFLRIFSAWILDESLPWTTGEAPTLKMLFKYLSITYPLPSDTTWADIALHIISITTDNASVNDVLIETVSSLLQQKYQIPESPKTLQMRCIGHVVNLASQDIMAAIGCGETMEQCDYHTFNKSQPLHLDIDTDQDQLNLEEEAFDEILEDEEEITPEEAEKVAALKTPIAKVNHPSCLLFLDA
ncbi:hypothetical protein C8J56DRAFT_791591 [Mycena floridula]|nr:hypothetical protein C8J56DRAFT_791591 [Mycena floridula]